MLHDAQNRFHHGHVAALNISTFKQPVWLNFRQHLISLRQSCFQTREQLGAINAAALIELVLPVALVRPLAHAADDLLLNIAGKMQDQIAHAVGSLVRPPPNIFLRQQRQTMFNLRQVGGSEVPACLFKKMLCSVRHCLISDLNNNFNLNRNISWQRTHPDRRARVPPILAKDLDKQIRAAIDDEWLLSKFGRGVDHP